MDEAPQDGPESRMLKIRRFVRGELQLGWGTILLGLLCISGGILCFTTWRGIWQSAGLPMIIMGGIVFWYGMLLCRRSYQTIKGMRQVSGSGEVFMNHYLSGIKQFTTRLNKTKDASAVLLGFSILGVVISCVVERLTFAVAAWLAIAAITGLLIAIVNTHLFLLELHKHAFTR